MSGALFYGNCQVSALAHIFINNEPFRSRYGTIYVVMCHVITEDELRIIYDGIIPSVDIIITQPIGDGYRGDIFSTLSIKKKMKTQCNMVTIPACWYSGYYPYVSHWTNILDKNGVPSEYSSVWYDRFTLRQWSENDKTVDTTIFKEEVSQILTDEESKKHHEECIMELQRREEYSKSIESPIDVPVSDIILEHYTSVLLFDTPMHPTSIFYGLLAERIACHIGLPNPDPIQHTNIDGLVILPSTCRSLHLTFTRPEHFRMYKDLDTKEYDEFLQRGYSHFGEELIKRLLP